MGANLDYRIYPDSLGKKSIETRWAQDVDDSIYDSGHSYSGEIGMLGPVIQWRKMDPLESQNAAEEHLSEYHEKWNGAMAVPFKSGTETHWMIGGWCSS